MRNFPVSKGQMRKGKCSVRGCPNEAKRSHPTSDLPVCTVHYNKARRNGTERAK